MFIPDELILCIAPQKCSIGTVCRMDQVHLTFRYETRSHSRRGLGVWREIDWHQRPAIGCDDSIFDDEYWVSSMAYDAFCRRTSKHLARRVAVRTQNDKICLKAERSLQYVRKTQPFDDICRNRQVCYQ